MPSPLDESEVDSLVDCKPNALCECSGYVELADQPQRDQVDGCPVNTYPMTVW